MVIGATNEYLLPQTLPKQGLSPPGSVVDRWSVLRRLDPFSPASVFSTCWVLGLNIEFLSEHSLSRVTDRLLGQQF